jgi:hypothetical protein
MGVECSRPRFIRIYSSIVFFPIKALKSRQLKKLAIQLGGGTNATVKFTIGNDVLITRNATGTWWSNCGGNESEIKSNYGEYLGWESRAGNPYLDT